MYGYQYLYLDLEREEKTSSQFIQENNSKFFKCTRKIDLEKFYTDFESYSKNYMGVNLIHFIMISITFMCYYVLNTDLDLLCKFMFEALMRVSGFELRGSCLLGWYSTT
jgi:hypothetical protein